MHERGDCRISSRFFFQIYSKLLKVDGWFIEVEITVLEQIRCAVQSSERLANLNKRPFLNALPILAENQRTIKDTLDFAKKLENRSIDEDEIVVSHNNVISLLTEKPLDEQSITFFTRFTSTTNFLNLLLDQF